MDASSLASVTILPGGFSVAGVSSIAIQLAERLYGDQKGVYEDYIGGTGDYVLRGVYD